MKGYGRAPTFLLATAYEQIRSIAALTGDTQAAARVEVELPETGAWRAPKAELAANATCCSAPPFPRNAGRGRMVRRPAKGYPVAVTIFHNPGGGTSRTEEAAIIEYRKAPPPRQQLKAPIAHIGAVDPSGARVTPKAAP